MKGRLILHIKDADKDTERRARAALEAAGIQVHSSWIDPPPLNWSDTAALSPDAKAMLQLLKAEPTLLPEAPPEVTAEQIEHRRLAENHPCLRCGGYAHVAYLALTPVGNRWLDLCLTCDHWLRKGE